MGIDVTLTWLGAALLLGVGASLIGHGRKEARTARQSASWRQMPARILSSTVRKQEHRTGDGHVSYSFFLEVRYAYEVAGKAFQSDRIGFGVTAHSAEAQAFEDIQRYPVGATVKAWVDPADPAKATLDTTPRELGNFFLFGIGFIALGLFLAVLPLFYD